MSIAKKVTKKELLGALDASVRSFATQIASHWKDDDELSSEDVGKILRDANRMYATGFGSLIEIAGRVVWNKKKKT